MSVTSEVLNVQLRDCTGTAASVRLRRTGMVPAVLYGHGEANRHLAIPGDQVATAIRNHSKTVTLQGAISDTALVSNVQFDHLGIRVLHLDLIRVNLKEKVEVEVPISLLGDSVGVRNGGMLLENMHSVTVRCPAGEIPESLSVDVSDLDLDQQRIAGELELPAGVELVTPPESVITHVEKPRGQVEGEPVAEETEQAEPAAE